MLGFATEIYGDYTCLKRNTQGSDSIRLLYTVRFGLHVYNHPRVQDDKFDRCEYLPRA